MQLQNMLRFPVGWARASGQRHEIVLSTRVRLARNLAHSPFPSRASNPALKRVLEETFAAARRTALREAAFFELADLDDIDRDFLVERHLISPHLAETPAQRGVIVGSGETASIMVNEEDHLRLARIEPGLALEAAYREAGALDDALGEAMAYAFRKDWGYLTACPTNLGTGMRASCLVHLPALSLSGLINRVLESLGRAGLIARGFYGEGTRVIGDFFQISNATGLGRTEGEILTAIERAVGQLADREREARAALTSGVQLARLEDRVHRSIGLLTHARVMPFQEACQHLSSLRLAHALGWPAPADLAAVNELLLLVQPAHVQMRARKELSEQEAGVQRAALIRERLSR